MPASSLAAPALDLHDVHKRFANVAALDGASLTVREGTVHALLGENGAGKTTLMRIAYGMLAPDAGGMRVFGAEMRLSSPADALRAGIGMVHQHFALVDAMRVSENVALGGRGAYQAARAAERVTSVAAASGLAVDPSARVESLSVGDRQRVEIVKALARDVRILILDEPTAVLPPSEAAELLQWVRAFATGGRSAILITHKLRDALAIADDVTVLRAGRTILSRPASNVSADTLALAMLGESQPILPGGAKWRGREGGTVVVEARGLDVSDDRGVIRVRAASFDIPAGSIVAIAGVEGAGQSALMRTLAARRAPAGGALRLPSSIGFIPADRQRDALILEMTLIENVALRDAARRRGWLRPGDMEARTARLLQDHDVRAPGPRARAATLSGGNQQKLVVARELDPLPELLVAENPARGLDVRAAQEVQSRLRAAASVGAAVVVTSSDLEELVSLADHALVLHAGALVPAPLDVLALGRAMVGA